jgi:hypothetical protein
MTGIALQLDLRPGDWVAVRDEAEILATLDDRGTLDAVPFMPEMLAHCGQRYQVFKRADKTCDTVTWTGLRSMERTVHLDMLRCDGSLHGGCQAGCLLFWKEAWLKRVPAPADSNGPLATADHDARPSQPAVATQPRRDRAWLQTTIHRSAAERPATATDSEPCYRCQATELVKFTCPLPWWKPRQYYSDVCHNDVPLTDVARGLAIATYSKLHRAVTGHSFPSVAGSLTKTPTASLDLQPGEWVVIGSKEEILATLDKSGKNRGMTFDSEMLPYCGQTARVLRRVERIVEETTGRLIRLPGVSIILDGVVCLARYRRSCPRSIYPFWREIWLRRAEPHEIAAASAATEHMPDCQPSA